MLSTFYDEKARPIQVVSINARGGQDIVTTQLDFVGKVEQSYSMHQDPRHDNIVVQDELTYDHAGRVKEVRQQLPGETVPFLVARHRYNEVGQLVSKTLSPDRPLTRQQVDYSYTIQGRLRTGASTRRWSPTSRRSRRPCGACSSATSATLPCLSTTATWLASSGAVKATESAGPTATAIMGPTA